MEESWDSSHQFYFIPTCKHDGQQLQNTVGKKNNPLWTRGWPMWPDFSKTQTSCTLQSNHRFHHFSVPSVSLWFPLHVHSGRKQMLIVSVCILGRCFPVPLSNILTFPTFSGSSSGNPLAKSSPLGPMTHSPASKLYLPPINSVFTLLGYRLGDEQETPLLLTEKKAEFMQNQITWSNRWSLLTYASSVWSSSFAMLNSFWGSVHWKKSYK